MPRLLSAHGRRGSALILAMILLAVLSVIGIAAVSLSSQDRTNSASVGKLEFLNACANASQAKIWAEMSQYGLSYLGSTVKVSAMKLPDGTKLQAPAHYDTPEGAGAPLVKDVVFKAQAVGNEMNERDCTNGVCPPTPFGNTYYVTAVCTDRFDRKHEIELAVKLAL